MFKKGDKVKVIGGFYKGETGEVIATYNVFDKNEVDDMFLVKGDKFDNRHFFAENLELVPTEHTVTDVTSERLKAKAYLNSLYGSSIYCDTDSVENELPDLFKPNHYQGKNGDLFDEWYARYPFETFRIILLTIAERYFRRYHLKDGLDGLSKGIEVMKRLREYELKEQNNG